MNKNNWMNLDITYLFVINGHICEVIIPKKDNIYVLKKDYCSDYEGWYNGINYFENVYNTKIWNQFDYLCLMNASTTGPFMDEDINNHWLIPFYNKMILNKAIAISPYINKFPPNILSCHFTLLYIDENIINLLVNTKIKIGDYNNTIIGVKKDKTDAVLTGEQGLSVILINNGYKIDNLYFDDLNIQYKDICKDREEFYHVNNNLLKNTIFIKNIWRIENKEYASLPVLYEYCNNYIFEKLNMKNIFKEVEINNNNHGINIYFSDSNWNSKREYYELYGYAEESIIFPIKNNNNNFCVIYAHYDINNIIADYVISSIKSLICIGYDIIFYTASDKINNIDLETLPFKVNFVKNIGIGTDYIMWLHGLNFILGEKLNYEWIMLLNDSILLPINGIINMKNTINNMRNTSDFLGHWDSYEISYDIIYTRI